MGTNSTEKWAADAMERATQTIERYRDELKATQELLDMTARALEMATNAAANWHERYTNALLDLSDCRHERDALRRGE